MTGKLTEQIVDMLTSRLLEENPLLQQSLATALQAKEALREAFEIGVRSADLVATEREERKFFDPTGLTDAERRTMSEYQRVLDMVLRKEMPLPTSLTQDSRWLLVTALTRLKAAKPA